VRSWAAASAAAAFALAACHPTEQPPIPPPKPTNPSTLAEPDRRDPASEAVALTDPGGASRLDVIDASIVIEGSTGWDGATFQLDAGAATRRTTRLAP
jgi:hypothetical protein